MKFLLIVSCLCLASCQSAYQVEMNKIKTELNNSDPKWTTQCHSVNKDAYGKKIGDSGCWLMVAYYGKPLVYPNKSMGVSMIAKVGKNGPQLEKAKIYNSDICAERPKRMAVDGKRIDNLTVSQQIQIMRQGKTFTREVMRPWPYCNLYDEDTSLKGFAENYDKMLENWKNFPNK